MKLLKAPQLKQKLNQRKQKKFAVFIRWKQEKWLKCHFRALILEIILQTSKFSDELNFERNTYSRVLSSLYQIANINLKFRTCSKLMNCRKLIVLRAFHFTHFPFNFILLTFRNGYAKFSLIKKKKFLMWCTAIVPNGTELWAQKNTAKSREKRRSATF